jgi:hypothetical protein
MPLHVQLKIEIDIWISFVSYFNGLSFKVRVIQPKLYLQTLLKAENH